MIGIIFATRREAAPLLQRLGCPRPADGEMQTVRLGENGPTAVVVCSGIGPAAAAAATNRLLEQHRVTAVVNAGICGAVAPAISIGATYWIAETRLESVSAPIRCQGGPWQRLLGEQRLITCATPVFEAARRQALASWGGLVDMEGAAIAAACRQHRLPCYLIKAVSDLADAQGKQAVKENLDGLSEQIAELLMAGLPQLEPPVTPVKRMIGLVKVEHTIFSLPLLLAGAWLGAGRQWPSWQVLLLIMVAGTGARTVGMAMNRIIDRRLDAVNPRTIGRELPSGQLLPGDAWKVAVAGMLVYLVACILLGPVCAALSPVPLVPLLLYSYLKRFTSLCHFGIGVCLGLAPLAAFVAASGGIGFDRPVLVLALYSFCWISGFDIVYALQDIESDRRTGVCSLPAALGWRGASLVAAGVHLVALAAAVALLLLTGGQVLAWVALVVTAISLALAHLPLLPLPQRFFPLTAFAGVAGALIPMLGGAP